MNLNTVLAALGGGAKVVTTASSAAILLGAIYLVDCRMSAKSTEAIDRCYFTAMPIMGIGVAGRGAFQVGYNTLNPSLHREETVDREKKEDRDKKEGGGRKDDRDDHGRFVKKDRA